MRTADRLSRALIALVFLALLPILLPGCRSSPEVSVSDQANETTADAEGKKKKKKAPEVLDTFTSGNPDPHLSIVIRNGDQVFTFSDGDQVSFTVDHCAPIELTVTATPWKKIRRLTVSPAGKRTLLNGTGMKVMQTHTYPSQDLVRTELDPSLEFMGTYDLGSQGTAGVTGAFVSTEMTWNITAKTAGGKQAKAEIIGYFAAASRDPVFIPGVGWKADGAGTAAGDVNGNGKADLVLLAYDKPDGGNDFRYRMAWDLKYDGSPKSWSDWHKVAGVGSRGAGAGVDMADLNNNGKPDLLVMAYDDPDGQNSFRYRVGMDLNSQGVTSQWSDWKQVGGVGKRAEGAGLAVADLNGNGKPEMVLMAYDDAGGTNPFRYMVGHDLDSTGTAASWSGWHQVAGVGNSGDGAGAAIADLDRNGTPDLVLMACDRPSGPNSFRYRVGWNLGANGTTSSWSNWKQVEGLGDHASGAGLTITQLPGNFMPQLLFMAYDLGTEFRYRIESWVACGD